MFYRLIQKKCDEWMHSPDCTIRELVQYIYEQDKMRDAQIEAIKIYLFLKIACKNKPLWQLFSEGYFYSELDYWEHALAGETRVLFARNKAAVALFEYAVTKGKNGRPLAPQLEKLIRADGNDINYEEVFKTLFYGVTYPDYIFSLPMGAGKTYLMAAFIYLDLYFAQTEPGNPAFAHNFMVLAPSGLKSSIIPSLKNIKEFDPAWIIPDPAASNLRRMVRFEVLDEHKSDKNSNIVKNPNAQKINNYQPLEDLMGLVAITNAEKVILDHVGNEENEGRLFSRQEMMKVRMANELRDIIGSIPRLSVIIDEVHHAADGEIKLRQVVEEWTKRHSFCGVLGFSGTPYLEKSERMTLAGGYELRNTELSNVVYHYPLIKGVGNFLKVPVVNYADNDTEIIVTNGVKEFFDKYIHTVYANGTCAKLAIYCGQIETLEETIYPLVAHLVSGYGLNPTEIILKYHGGNKSYPKPDGAETEFASLDTDFSKIRVVLLVQIGKEGWDCKSLAGVILPQKGVCPKNMVLQTSCRCLRQVERNSQESALIWLNKFNADTLNEQLKQQQNITLREFNDCKPKEPVQIERFSRMEKMEVPPIDFYQLKVSYHTLTTEDNPHTAEKLADGNILTEADATLVHKQDLVGNVLGMYIARAEEGGYVSFRKWLCLIVKEGFNMLRMDDLKMHEDALKTIFHKITLKDKDGNTRYDTRYDHAAIRSSIRKAFVAKRDFTVKEEIVPCRAELLLMGKPESPVLVDDDKAFYPSQEAVKEILDWDVNAGNKVLTSEELALIEKMKKMGYKMPQTTDPHPERKQTYHYLPYRFDSGLEHAFFKDTILPCLADKPLEAYFNGDDTLTGFKIDCYRQVGKEWVYDGKYVPDFLLLDRNTDGTIHRIIIIETKGGGYAAKFADRRKFMETEFVSKNNERFGYERFRFLYFEDTESQEKREMQVLKAINNFFNI